MHQAAQKGWLKSCVA